MITPITTAELLNVLFDGFSSFLLFMTAISALYTIKEAKRSTRAAAFKTVYDLLETDDVISSRKIVINNLPNKKMEKWTQKELMAAEKVCRSYDAVGIMVRNKIIDEKIVSDSWGHSLRTTWKILAGLVNTYRELRNSTEFWDDYEWLARKSERYQKPIH